MGIIQKEVLVKITNFNIDYYQEKGYFANKNDSITIPIEDLSPGSGIKVDVQCNYCKKIFQKPYRDYLKSKDKVCCKNCRKHKFAETNLIRYGNACSLRNAEIHEKAKATLMEKYGVEYPLESKEIQNKCRQTCKERYNSETYHLSSQDISRIMKKQCSTGVPSSKEQNYLHSLYGGKLNVRFGRFYVDILFPDEKICLEYNGGGHYLSVIHGNCTIEELQKKDYEKCITYINNGFKCFIIENTKHGFPADNVLIEIKERGFEVLKNEPDVCIYTYNLVSKTENLLRRSEL